MSSTHSKYHIGIDLGTTNCSVAVFENGRVKVIEDIQGNRRIPSYVAFTDSEYLVGFPARNQVDMNSSNTVHNVKRLLGRKFDDPELESDMKYWQFSVIDEKGRPKIQVQYKKEAREFCPEEITALILTEMKEMAESHIGEKSGVVDVVISVPANFNNLQRKATMDAAHIAGLNVLHLMNDSTAAALAYCTEKKITETHNICNILVLDLGGGSFDVSMVSIQGRKLDVKAVSGETHLGGEDFVNNMLSHIAEDFQQNGNMDITNKRSLAGLKYACDVAKKELSKLPQARIAVEGCDYFHNVNTEMFKAYNDKLYNKIMEHVDKVVMASGVGKDPFVILLIGGCTRVPKIEELLKTTYSGVRISKGINRDEAVAYGAAVQAALLHGDDSDAIMHIVELQDMKPKSLFVRQEHTNMRICISEHSNIQHLVPIRYSIPDPNQNIDVNVQMAIGANGVLKFIHSSQEEIIDDENCISKENIDIMKKTIQVLKNDCNLHRELMRCRNSLEEFIINVQAKFRKVDNNDRIMSECEKMLDWMSSNEGATKQQYENHQKNLKTLQDTMLTSVSTTRSLPLKAFQKSEISKTNPKSASTNNLSQVQPITPEVESSEKRHEINTVSMPKLDESQNRPPLPIGSTSHDTSMSVSETAGLPPPPGTSHDTFKSISEIGRTQPPLDSARQGSSKGASQIDNTLAPLDSTGHDDSRSVSGTAGPIPQLDSTGHDHSKGISENDRPQPPFDSTSQNSSKSDSEIGRPSPPLDSASQNSSKSDSEIGRPSPPLDSARQGSSKGASQIDNTLAPLDSTGHDDSRSVSGTAGPITQLDSTGHDNSKGISENDRPQPPLDSACQNSSKSGSEIGRPSPPLDSASQNSSKSGSEIGRPSPPLESASHNYSKGASQIDSTPGPLDSTSHDTSNSISENDKPPSPLDSTSHKSSNSDSEIGRNSPQLDSARHDSSKGASQIDSTPAPLDSAIHDSSKGASQIDSTPAPLDSTNHDASKSLSETAKPPPPLDATSHDTSKSAAQINRHPLPSGSRSDDNSKSAAQIDKPTPQSGSKSHDKSKSGSAHGEQKIPQKDSTSKPPEQKPATTSDKRDETGEKMKEEKQKKPKKCTIS